MRDEYALSDGIYRSTDGGDNWTLIRGRADRADRRRRSRHRRSRRRSRRTREARTAPSEPARSRATSTSTPQEDRDKAAKPGSAGRIAPRVTASATRSLGRIRCRTVRCLAARGTRCSELLLQRRPHRSTRLSLRGARRALNRSLELHEPEDLVPADTVRRSSDRLEVGHPVRAACVEATVVALPETLKGE